MLRIDSYIIKNKNVVIKDLEMRNDELFVNIKDVHAIDASALDYDYLNGCIRIVYKGVELLGFKDWDLVDQLWEYFIDALIKFNVEDRVAFTFPDQPLLVEIEKKNVAYLRLNINSKTANINSMDFIEHMYVSAELFFKNLLLLFPEKEHDIQLSIKKINELKDVYKL